MNKKLYTNKQGDNKMNVVEELLRTLRYYLEMAQKNDGTFQCETAKGILNELCKLVPKVFALEEISKDKIFLHEASVMENNLAKISTIKKGWPKGKKRGPKKA